MTLVDITGRPLETAEARQARVAGESRQERTLLLEAFGLLLGLHPETLAPNQDATTMRPWREQLAQAIAMRLPPEAILKRWHVRIAVRES